MFHHLEFCREPSSRDQMDPCKKNKRQITSCMILCYLPLLSAFDLYKVFAAGKRVNVNNSRNYERKPSTGKSIVSRYWCIAGGAMNQLVSRHISRHLPIRQRGIYFHSIDCRLFLCSQKVLVSTEEQHSLFFSCRKFVNKITCRKYIRYLFFFLTSFF